MSDATDPLAPFDDDLIAAVAADRDRSSAAVADLVTRHQSFVRDSPGVDDLVYEWRRFMPADPLVARTDDAFHLAVEPRVWAQFGDQMGLEADDVTTVRAVHDRQARRAARERGASTDAFESGAAVVLGRE